MNNFKKSTCLQNFQPKNKSFKVKTSNKGVKQQYCSWYEKKNKLATQRRGTLFRVEKIKARIALHKSSTSQDLNYMVIILGYHAREEKHELHSEVGVGLTKTKKIGW